VTVDQMCPLRYEITRQRRHYTTEEDLRSLNEDLSEMREFSVCDSQASRPRVSMN